MEIKQGPLNALVEEWLSSETRCDATKMSYRRVFCVYNKWIILHTPYANALGATRKDVVAFKADAESRGLSDNTVSSYLCVVKMFYAYAFRVGKVSTDAAAGIRVKAPRKTHRKKPLTDAQTHTLMMSLDMSVRRCRRDRLIMLLMLHAGLRCIEVSRLDRDDIYLERGAYRLHIRRKGHASKDSFIRLRDDLGRELCDFLANDVWEPEYPIRPMFPSMSSKNRIPVRLSSEDVSDIVKRCMKDAGVTGRQLGPHSLRHTFAVNLVKKGVPLEEIQLLLGHSSPATTMIYAIDAKEQKIEENNPAELLDKL